MSEEKTDETLEKLAKFHGHLGPYVVVGYRMGKIANREISEDPFEKEAVAMTGGDPPVSCIVDGVQYSSGCTLGKGNVEIKDNGKPTVKFRGNGKSLNATLGEKVQNLIEKAEEKDLEDLAVELFEMPEDELLEVNNNGKQTK